MRSKTELPAKALNPFQTPRPLQAILRAVSRLDLSEFKKQAVKP